MTWLSSTPIRCLIVSVHCLSNSHLIRIVFYFVSKEMMVYLCHRIMSWLFKTNYSSAGLQLKFAQAVIPSQNYIPAARNEGPWPSQDLGPTGSNSPLALLISSAGSTVSHLLIYSLLFSHGKLLHCFYFWNGLVNRIQ